MATMTGGTALAERPTESMGLPTLGSRRHAAGSEMLPAVRPAAYLHRIARLPEGVLSGLPGAVTDLAVSRDGAHLVAAHYGEDAVSVIDTATLHVTARVSGIAEPSAVATADRAYLRSASIDEDIVVAVDLNSGAALAAREVGVGAGGITVSPAGDLLYVARSADDVADIAVIEVESGNVSTIPVSRAAGASLEALRIDRAGTRLYAALTTASGGALVIVHVRTGGVQIVPVGAAIGEIAVAGDGRRVFVTGWDEEMGAMLHAVDVASARVARSVAVDGRPVAILTTGSAVFLAHDEDVTVMDPVTLRTTNGVHIGRQVSALAISRDGTRLYIGDFDGAVTALPVPGADQGMRAAS
jgi:YVTN family beta-propeller protein